MIEELRNRVEALFAFRAAWNHCLVLFVRKVGQIVAVNLLPDDGWDDARNRLLQWLCAKHKLVWPAAKRFPESSLHDVLGLVCLAKRTGNFPWATS